MTLHRTDGAILLSRRHLGFRAAWPKRLPSLRRGPRETGAKVPGQARTANSPGAFAFTNDSTLGEVLDAWITDPVTTDARSVGTVLRYRHAIDKTIKGRNVGTGLAGVRVA